jgi:hypothetical protein
MFPSNGRLFRPFTFHDTAFQVRLKDIAVSRVVAPMVELG